MTLQGHQPDVSVDVDISDPVLAADLAPLALAQAAPGIPSYLLTDRLPATLPAGRTVLLLSSSALPVTGSGLLSVPLDAARHLPQLLSTTAGWQALTALSDAWAATRSQVMDTLTEGLIWTTADFRVLGANRVARTLFNWPAEWGSLLTDHLPEAVERLCALREGLGLDQQEESLALDTPTADGDTLSLSLHMTRLDNEILQLHVADVSRQKSADQRFMQLANYDPMTGLANRGLLFEFVQRAISRCKRRGSHAAVLLVHFARNSSGDSVHISDELLVALAERLGITLREEDLVARWGGDEIAIVLEEVNQPDDARKVAEHVIGLFTEPVVVDNRESWVSPTLGIAVYPEAASEAEALIQSADTAMLSARAHGRNTYRFFTNTMQDVADERSKIERHLRQAIERDEFRLMYQPKVSLARETVIGFEALLRWEHPEWQSVSPARFIPVAEECGAINAIGDWVLRSACTQLMQWHDEMPSLRDCSIAVNVSPRQLSEPSFVDRVAGVLRDTGIPPNMLEIELTESSVMENPEEGIALLQRIHALGVKISIDDFGTGYSSLSCLQKLPIDCVKIDRSFVIGIGNDLSAESIIHAILVMSESMGLSNVAEGVETDEQIRFFEGVTCDVIQGYYFSKPLTPAEIESTFGAAGAVFRDRFLHLAASRPPV